jgi:hypothetical protein
VLRTHVLRTCKRSDRLRDAGHARAAPSRQRQPLDRTREEGVRLGRPPRRIAESFPRGDHARADGRRVFAGLPLQLDCARPWDRHDEVEAIE